MHNEYSKRRVFSRARDQLKHGFWPALAFTAIAYIAGSVISSMVTLPFTIGSTIASLQPGAAAAPPDPFAMFSNPTFVAAWLVSVLLTLASTSLLYAGLFHAYAVAREDERLDVGDLLQVAFRKMLPVLGVSLLSSLGIALGFVLLIVPGIILSLMWGVAMPVCVAENLGVIDSLKRSAALTKGSKLQIFLTWLLLVAVVLGIYLLVVLVAVGIGVAIFASLKGGAPGGGLIAVGIILGIVLILALIAAMVVFYMYMVSLQASIYRETRLVREGTAGNGLREVFE
jgi:uncharacterized membrane protein